MHEMKTLGPVFQIVVVARLVGATDEIVAKSLRHFARPMLRAIERPIEKSARIGRDDRRDERTRRARRAVLPRETRARFDRFDVDERSNGVVNDRDVGRIVCERAKAAPDRSVARFGAAFHAQLGTAVCGQVGAALIQSRRRHGDNDGVDPMDRLEGVYRVADDRIVAQIDELLRFDHFHARADPGGGKNDRYAKFHCDNIREAGRITVYASAREEFAYWAVTTPINQAFARNGPRQGNEQASGDGASTFARFSLPSHSLSNVSLGTSQVGAKSIDREDLIGKRFPFQMFPEAQTGRDGIEPLQSRTRLLGTMPVNAP